MSPPRTGKDVLELVRKSGLTDAATIDAFLQKNGPLPTHPGEAAAQFYLAGILTELQAEFILKGKPEACRLGKYVLLARLGYATGELFHALHPLMKRRVSIEILPSELTEEDSYLPQERLCFRDVPYRPPIDHPNVARGYDLDCHDEKRFVVFEYLEGKRFPAVLDEAGGKLPVGEACGCAIQAAKGLHFAHESGVTHERINPSNLFVCDNGTVKILEQWFATFGLPRYFEIDPVYTAPEQHLDSYPVDRRCDCYSLGAVLFRMLCGRPPIDLQGGADWLKSPADLKQKFMSTPTPMPDDGVPPALASVLTRMMAPRVADRYQSMAEVIAALRPFVEPESTGDYPEMAAAALAQPT